MSHFETIHAAFDVERQTFMRSKVIQRLSRGEIRVAHYAQLMRQIFHQARENPQIQVLATVRLRGSRRVEVAGFCRHAASEVGHDELALADYAACGGDPEPVRIEFAHPATTAVTAFAFHQIYNLNPVGYLGYLFFLEFLPTTTGGALMHQLSQVGVPGNAFSFLQDHVTVDVGHNRAMERYCSTLILNQSDLESVIYALRATAHLYTAMIEAAVESADSARDFGVNPEERLALIER